MLRNWPGRYSTIAIAVLLTFAATMRSASADPLTPDEAGVLAGSCANCHGPDGRSQGAIPSIAGRPEADLKTSLLAFRSGQPADATVMPRIARGYDEAQIEALARYYAALPAGRPR